jgi:hypothetical protein
MFHSRCTLVPVSHSVRSAVAQNLQLAESGFRELFERISMRRWTYSELE